MWRSICKLNSSKYLFDRLGASDASNGKLEKSVSWMHSSACERSHSPEKVEFLPGLCSTCIRNACLQKTINYFSYIFEYGKLAPLLLKTRKRKKMGEKSFATMIMHSSGSGFDSLIELSSRGCCIYLCFQV
jgi:hypothetical protein